jgi:hypothetical protein
LIATKEKENEELKREKVELEENLLHYKKVAKAEREENFQRIRNFLSGNIQQPPLTDHQQTMMRDEEREQKKISDEGGRSDPIASV